MLRKGKWAGPNGEASKVTIRNCCQSHFWRGPASEVSGSSSSSGSSLPIMQAFAMYEFERDFGMLASPEWYDGPDDI